MERFLSIARRSSGADVPSRRVGRRATPLGWWRSLQISHRLLILAGTWIIYLLVSVLLSVVYSAAIIDESSTGGELSRAEATLTRLGEQQTVFDADLAGRIAVEQGLTGARFDWPASIQAGEVAVPLPSGDGRSLVWQPRRLGSELFQRLAPLRVAATVVFLIGLGYAFFRLFRLAGELETRRRLAHDEARRDGLTRLTNRLGFDEALAEMLGAGVPVGILTFDLDGFKQVNDLHGHGAGDELLRVVADRLRSRAEPTDLVARIGGDEFAILRANPFDRASLDELAADLAVVLSGPMRIGAAEHVVTASCGVAMAPGDADTPDALLREADLRLYRDKRGVRDGLDPADLTRAA